MTMGFFDPLGLLSLGFLAVLVWIYLRERHRREVEVPSLLLWRSIADERRRSRFEIDPLFLLQALLLTLLGLGLARPYLESGAATVAVRRAVLVFDTSASMQALEDGESRFAQARRAARDVIAALGPSDEVMVVTVEARPRIVLAYTRDRTAVRRVIERLEPGDGPSRLALGIQLARSSHRAADGRLDIVVFTDLPREHLAVPLAAGEHMRYFRFGRTDDNVALAALRVYQSPFQDSAEARAYALVKNHSRSEKEAELRATLDGREVLRERFRLAPREGRAVQIRDLGRPGRLEARLDVADALEADDRAIAYVRPVRSIRLLVAARESLLRDLRALAEAVPVLHIREAQADEIDESRLRSSDVAIFDGVVPEPPLHVNALFIYPPVDNPLFPVEREAVDASILDWDEEDPILRDLRYVEALPLAHARMIRPPGWARTLISSRAEGEEFPLAFAGELDGRRMIVFAFDLAEHSVRRTENLSLLLLVLNAIKWLTPPDPTQPIQIDVGDRYRKSLLQPAALTVVSPDGERREWPERSEVSVEIERRGEYRIRVGHEERTVYANLFDPEESDIGRDGPLGVETIEAGEAPARLLTARYLREWGWWLYLAAFLILVAEWLLDLRRRSANA